MLYLKRALLFVFLAVTGSLVYRTYVIFFPPRVSNGLTVAAMSSVRGALQAYAAANQGRYPADLGELVLNAKYLANIPPAGLKEHPISNAVQYMSGEDFKAGRFTDAGGWAYVNSPDEPQLGGLSQI